MFAGFFDPCCASSKNDRKDVSDGESIFSMLSCGGRQKSSLEKSIKKDECSKLGRTGISKLDFDRDSINIKSSEFKEFRQYLKKKFANNNEEYMR